MNGHSLHAAFRHRPTTCAIAIVLASLGALCASACVESGVAHNSVDRNAPSASATTLGADAKGAYAKGAGADAARTEPTQLRADPQRLREDVAWLAADARDGRRAGTAPAASAGEWIAQRLRALGLEPAGEDGGWFQQFSVPLDARDGGASQLTWKNARGEQSTARAAHELVPLFCSERGEVHGPLVFCGYGIEDAEQGWDDFAHKELAGSIALIVRGTPPDPEHKPDAGDAAGSASKDTQLVTKGGRFEAQASIFTKIMNAKRHGAIGVLLAPQPEHAKDPLLAFDAGHAARAGIPAVMINSGIATELVGDDLAFVLEEAGLIPGALVREVAMTADVVREKGEASNVLGLVRGRDSTRCVVVGAHYDHLGHGGSGSLAVGSSAIHHGADDNASGTATVLEIARLCKQGAQPACDVLFALWSGEELGLLGSEHWAQHPTVPLEHVRANLNLDMVGRAASGKLQVLGAGTSPVFASWMDEAGAHAGLELAVSTAGDALGGSSDHQSFLKRGIPALHLFSGLHSDYHKPTDTADKFEAEGASKVAMLGVEFVERLCAAPELAFVAPKVEPPQPGQQPSPTRGGFRAWFGSIPNYTFEGPGVLMDGTSAGSPAERAGFLRGDVLTQLGDVEIKTIYDFTYALQRYKPGDVVAARYLRDGQTLETRITLSSRELK